MAVTVGIVANTAVAQAGTLYMQQCYNTPGATPAFVPAVSPLGFTGGVAVQCPNTTSQGADEGIYVFGTQGASGTQAYWLTQAPPGISITHAWLPGYYDNDINNGGAWGGGFFWAGGGAQVPGAGQNFSFNSPYFGWRIVCANKAGCSGFGEIGVWHLQLTATETQGPRVTAFPSNNLWYHNSSYVRGVWPLSFTATDPSGVCTTVAAIDGQFVVGPGGSPNSTIWHQCPDQAWDYSLNTADYPNGPMKLTLIARNAAGVSSAPSTTREVDNTRPAIALQGPTDAAVTSGVQFINAYATTSGPSGIAGIGCSLDEGTARWFPGAYARIPVAGLGDHRLECWSANTARDPAGNLGISAPANWSLSIRKPAVSTVSFARVVDALRCKRVRERVRVPANWVTVLLHGRPVRVKLPAETRTLNFVRCHPLVVRKRVRVRGRWRTERLVLLPHTVQVNSRRVAAGAETTVRGWLGTADGLALGGQRVTIVTAADDGRQAFGEAAATTTAQDGTWSARLPAGPSRLVRAVFSGAALTEPALSAPAHIDVPASVRLGINPRHAHWGGTIVLSGKLLGGYIPPAGEVLFVRLKFNGKRIEVAHVRTNSTGRFSTTYTFLGGAGLARYPFWLTTVPESDYPFAAGSSRPVTVTVSP